MGQGGTTYSPRHPASVSIQHLFQGESFTSRDFRHVAGPVRRSASAPAFPCSPVFSRLAVTFWKQVDIERADVPA